MLVTNPGSNLSNVYINLHFILVYFVNNFILKKCEKMLPNLFLYITSTRNISLKTISVISLQ
ncbi:hypothetical protein GLOIN_2v1687668 [Rhizophagus irregularis DAOM 181602=DAOM 197198]|uniref:Uncharacterized protein n=1 Tax=Rhizophagus irregularis (strain DAOM 181602 / DAOM 197198 / MUCL 43194) TaxID=747089 RepID=A0A2P4PD31_RHIID|nr:hypothetical protein GLOIN_2v1687668 [Rhizophagus irregularis DAOM 181602=DAOM 197198]POG63290.1 hypothetical protein GLOIN_2v1687668 [Rhizophagus irregularis DAOM 181602=DAOM 197198]|eukprot:XP_025170156.1 hypothetical protein GLOIN_2v1687668 [Rhizophagus irregularis DAOM 181602=DAOM 197198]